MRRSLAVFIVLVALAAGCGDDEPSRETSDTTSLNAADLVTTDIADVDVEGEPGAQPTLTFEEAFGVEATATRVLHEGDGAAIAANSVVTFHFVLVNGRDGEVIQTSYGSDPAELVFEDSLMAGIYKGLDGVTAGSQILVAVAPGDGPGADPSTKVLENDTLIFFFDVLDVRVPLARAEGAAVAPVAGVPTVELGDDGAPTIAVPAVAPPTELIAQPLIVGDGPVVETGDSITVHYTGVIWDSGVVFDSSWESGSPATFDIGTGAVIPGWDEGLVGRTVGSQIVLVVPPAKGYPEGSPDGTIKGTDTIVFVIDILDTSR